MKEISTYIIEKLKINKDVDSVSESDLNTVVALMTGIARINLSDKNKKILEVFEKWCKDNKVSNIRLLKIFAKHKSIIAWGGFTGNHEQYKSFVKNDPDEIDALNQYINKNDIVYKEDKGNGVKVFIYEIKGRKSTILYYVVKSDVKTKDFGIAFEKEFN